MTAVKKVIAAMTVGKDVSALFVDVLKCMQTTNIELKKLIYLYLMNYAKTQPEKVILAVSTFLRDSQDANPLIRALAIRTMACIRVTEIVEYIVDPLRRCLSDEDPYVRKTAAIAVAKLYDLSPELTDGAGFVTELTRLVSDSNPMVVSNAVAALTEISVMADKQMLTTAHETLNNLLAALSECSEWGQVFVLDALASYLPKGTREAEHVCERILPRLQHANPAVVLSSVKLVLMYLSAITNQEFAKNCLKKLAPPLVSLLSVEPELQYVALRCTLLVVQMHPQLLRANVQPFFVKYNDPLYVKLEKLDVLYHLAAPKNAEVLLNELKEYSQDVDTRFIGRAVRLIGLVGVKVASAAELAVRTLVGLMRAARERESHATPAVVEQGIVALRDMFRRYPKQYDGVMSEVCESLNWAGEGEGLAAAIWVVGEFSDRIANSAELISDWIDDWAKLNEEVRSQLLTATVKAFLKQPSSAQELVQLVLRRTTEDVRSPDLRDRAYVYWRLLSTRPEAAKQVVLSERPVTRVTETSLPEATIALLMRHISSLASVYHKPPSMFVLSNGFARADEPEPEPEPDANGDGANRDWDDGAGGGEAGDDDGTGLAAAGPARLQQPLPPPVSGSNLGAAALPPPGSGSTTAGGLLDLGSLLGVTAGPASSTATKQPASGGLIDLMTAGPTTIVSPVPAAAGGGANAAKPVDLLSSLFGGPAVAEAPGASASALKSPAETWLTGATGKGLQLTGSWFRAAGAVHLELGLTNQAMTPLSAFAIVFNVNPFGLAPGASAALASLVLGPGQSTSLVIPLVTNGPVGVVAEDPTLIQVAFKTSIDMLRFQCAVPLFVLFGEDGALNRQQFLVEWRAIAQEAEQRASLPAARLGAQALADALQTRANVFLLGLRDAPEVNGSIGMFSSKTHNGLWFMIELKITANEVGVALRTQHTSIAPQFFKSLAFLVQSL